MAREMHPENTAKTAPKETDIIADGGIADSRSQNREVHYMQLNPEPYQMIKCGQKTIELRLYDEKRRKISEGDEIVFKNTSNGKSLHVFVAKLHRFDNFGDLYDALPLLKCGYTAETMTEASPADMEQYYSVEKQKQFGVVGIEVYQPKEIQT